MGRAAIIMVMGYSTVLMMMGFNISKVSTRAYENYVNYYDRTVAHNLVSSAANIAAQAVFENPAWRDGFTNRSFSGGRISATVTTQSDSTIRIVARSEYRSYLDTIIVVLQASSFSRFAYYSNIEGSIWWTSGDTVWGPFHTQDRLRVANRPVFYGKVTSYGAIRYYDSNARPEFYGGYQSGVSLTLPSNLNPLKTAAQSGGRYIYDQDVTITFMGDSARVKVGTRPDSMVYLPTYIPNGALMVERGNLRVKGTVSGKYTISATKGTSPSKGKIYLDDDITYRSDPRTNPGSQDLLGIVAQDSIVITQNTANQNDIVIQAALFSLEKGVGAENYNQGSPRGAIHLLGGITQYQRAAVGTFSGSTIVTGYSKRYRYDERLMVLRPPFFPTSSSYEVVSWYER